MKERINELEKYYAGTIKSYMLIEVRRSGIEFLDKLLDKNYQEKHLYKHPLFKFFTTHFDAFEFVAKASCEQAHKTKHRIVFETLIHLAKELRTELKNE